MNYNILECKRFIAKCPNMSPARIVHNYEFDFYLKGGRTMCIDYQKSPIYENCICHRKPGQIVSSIGDYDCYILTVDFSKTTPTQNYNRNIAQVVEPIYDDILINSIPDVFIPKHSIELKILFSELSKQYDLNSDVSYALFEEIIFLINADLKHKYYLNIKSEKTFVENARYYIIKHFNENIQLDDIANYVSVDKSYLIREFKKHFSTTPIDYLLQCRLNHAQNLIASTSLSITEISDMCGYNSTSFFSTQFKKKFGITPSAYKLQISINMQSKNSPGICPPPVC